MQALFVEEQIDKMLAMGVIERPEAPHASPLVLVKKADGTYRGVRKFQRTQQNKCLIQNQ